MSRCPFPRRLMRSPGAAGGLWLILLGSVTLMRMAAQSTAAGAPVAPFDVSGKVVNGLTGAAIPRALVRMNGRTVLTDALGRFDLPQFTLTSGSVQVSKPGFTFSLDGDANSSQQVADLTSRLELRLYPDALVTGTVVGSDRQPLAQIQVVLYRETVNETGRRTVPMGFTSTDVHGGFRFQQPAGHYRVSVAFSQRPSFDGEVMLPVDYPEAGGTEYPPTFVVAPAEERRIDLHARTSMAYPVTFHTDGAGDQGNPRIQVLTPTGVSFSVFARSTPEPGDFRIDLPSGDYLLKAAIDTRDGRLESEAHVSVAGKAVTGLTLHFAPGPVIPVEMVIEPSTSASTSSTQSSPPNILSFNLRLQNISASTSFASGDVPVQAFAGQSPSFRPSTGRYRLQGQSGGTWFVRSATYGGTDLLSQPLVVTNGASPEPVRLIVSNDSGQLSGKVTGLVPGATAYVYLIAHQPSLAPVTLVRVNSDGTFKRTLPPGTYTVVAFDRRFAGDLTDVHDTRTAAQVSAGVSVEVPSSGSTSTEVPLQTMELAR